MSADKHPAEVVAENIEQTSPISRHIHPLADGLAMLRRIPALEAEIEAARSERDRSRIEIKRLMQCVHLLTERSDRENAERDQLRAEVEALRADAERYRWLRSENQTVAGPCAYGPWMGPTLRDAIDAARKQQ